MLYFSVAFCKLRSAKNTLHVLQGYRITWSRGDFTRSDSSSPPQNPAVLSLAPLFPFNVISIDRLCCGWCASCPGSGEEWWSPRLLSLLGRCGCVPAARQLFWGQITAYEGLLSHTALFMVRIISDDVSNRGVCTHTQSLLPPSAALTHQRDRHVAVVKCVMKIKGVRRWKPMQFQSRALFWGESSLVSQNAAHMEPVTVPAASKGILPSLPETKWRKQTKCHRDPGSFSPLFAIWCLRFIKKEKAQVWQGD